MARALGITVRAESPAWARGEISDPLVKVNVVVGDRVVCVKIVDVRFDVEIIAARAVVNDEDTARRDELFGALEGGAQSPPLLGLLEVSAPRFVDDGVNHDRRMIPVALNHGGENLFAALGCFR